MFESIINAFRKDGMAAAYDHTANTILARTFAGEELISIHVWKRRTFFVTILTKYGARIEFSVRGVPREVGRAISEHAMRREAELVRKRRYARANDARRRRLRNR